MRDASSICQPYLPQDSEESGYSLPEKWRNELCIHTNMIQNCVSYSLDDAKLSVSRSKHVRSEGVEARPKLGLEEHSSLIQLDGGVHENQRTWVLGFGWTFSIKLYLCLLFYFNFNSIVLIACVPVHVHAHHSPSVVQRVSVGVSSFLRSRGVWGLKSADQAWWQCLSLRACQPETEASRPNQ